MWSFVSLPQREARNGWMRECIRLWFPISRNTAANREKSMSASGYSWAMYQRLSCLPAEKRKALTCGEMKWIQTLNLKEETDYAVSDSREAQRGTADCQCHRGRGEKRRIHGGSGSIVSWCVGHLVELAQPDAYSDAWKKWTYESLPMIPENWQHEVKRDTAAQYKVLRELMHDTRVDSVVCATDAGREGELIFRLVYEMAGCNKPMKRLWISSMEKAQSVTALQI